MRAIILVGFLLFLGFLLLALLLRRWWAGLPDIVDVCQPDPADKGDMTPAGRWECFRPEETINHG